MDDPDPVCRVVGPRRPMGGVDLRVWNSGRPGRRGFSSWSKYGRRETGTDLDPGVVILWPHLETLKLQLTGESAHRYPETQTGGLDRATINDNNRKKDNFYFYLLQIEKTRTDGLADRAAWHLHTMSLTAAAAAWRFFPFLAAAWDFGNTIRAAWSLT